MNLVRVTPTWIKRLARKVLPERAVDSVHERAGGEGYIPWMVSRETALVLRFERDVLRQDPRLQRLVVHLTDHCNLNCKGCTHFSNIAKPAFADPGRFADEFERLSGIFSQINEIYLLGGEPLLHPRVTEFLEIARRYFPRSQIKLMSNGVLVPRMSEEFWRAMHDNRILLVCDLYPIGLKVEEIEALVERHAVELEWTDPARRVLQAADRPQRFPGRRALVPGLRRGQQLPDPARRPALPVRVRRLQRPAHGALRRRGPRAR